MILPNTPPWGHMTQITIRWERAGDGAHRSAGQCEGASAWPRRCTRRPRDGVWELVTEAIRWERVGGGGVNARRPRRS